MLWRIAGQLRDRQGDAKVDERTDGAEGIRLDTEEPVRLHVTQERGALHEHDALVLEHVEHGDRDTRDHAEDGAFAIHVNREDTHHQCREDRRRGQTECQGYRTGCEIRWVEAEVTGQGDGAGHGDTRSQQFRLLPDVRHEHALEQVMRDRRGDGQQQTRRGRQRRCQTTGDNDGDDPVRQTGNFRVRENHDVAVDLDHLVALPAELRTVETLVVVVLDAAVAVLVLVLQQAGLLPVPEPLRGIGVGQVARRGTDFTGLDGVGQVQASHGTNRRGGGVEDRDEDQRPASGSASVLDLRHGEEADDDVRQTGGTDHQGERVGDHVGRAQPEFIGIAAEAQFRQHLVETIEQEGPAAVRHGAAETQLRKRVAGQLQRDEDRRDGVGGDQHAVLGDLGVGNTLHATEHGVDEHDAHTDVEASFVAHRQEAGERHADALHLADNVSHRGDDQADDSHDAGRLRIVTLTDELRHGELTELTQVRCQQHRQQHVAAGPAHQEDRTTVAKEGYEASHRDERRRGHPVSRCGHTVCDRVNAFTSDVEFAGSTGAGPDRDADVEREGRAYDDIGHSL